MKWAMTAGGPGRDRNFVVVLDSSNTVYIYVENITDSTTKFNGGCTISGGTGNYDATVCLLDSNGSCFFSTYYSKDNDEVESGYIDANQNKYGTGYVQNSTQICGLPTESSINTFVARYSAAGSCTWAHRIISPLNYGLDIKADESGNVYVIGYFQGTAIFGDDTLIAQGYMDAYVVKYNSSGTQQWVKQIGGPGLDLGFGLSQVVDGVFYICGQYDSTVVFGEDTLTKFGSGDIFIAKMDDDGNFLWAKRAGSSTADYAIRIKQDNWGNVFVSGFADSAALFETQYLERQGDYIARYTSDGDLVWVKSLGRLTALKSTPGMVIYDSTICMASAFDANTILGTDTMLAQGEEDIYVCKLDYEGKVLWARNYGSTGIDRAYGMACDKRGNIYVTGTYGDTVVFENDTLTTWGTKDAFLFKMAPIYPIQSVAGGSNTVCEGDTFTVVFTSDENCSSGNIFTVQLSDSTGSFATVDTIGTLTDTIAGTISCVVDNSIPAGTHYRVRVVSSNPGLGGEEFARDISIYKSPSISISPSDTLIYAGQNLVLMGQGGTTYYWPELGDTSQAVTVAPLSDSSIYTLEVTDVNGCSAEEAVWVRVDTLSIGQEIQGNIPLYFQKNMGQWDSKVKYHAGISNTSAAFLNNGVTFYCSRIIEDSVSKEKFYDSNYKDSLLEVLSWDLSFVGSDTNIIPVEYDIQPTKYNYYFGNDTNNYYTNVPVYGKIEYPNLYDSIDLQYYATGTNKLEYNVVLKQGSNVNDCQLRFNGIIGLELDNDSNLVISTSWGDIVELAPVSYQTIGGSQVPVDVSFKIIDPMTYGFQINGSYDTSQSIIIDPLTLQWATFVQGSVIISPNHDDGATCNGVAVDVNHDTYMTGRNFDHSLTALLPTGSPGIHVYPLGLVNGSLQDAYVLRFNASATQVDFVTIIGSTGFDVSNDIGLGSGTTPKIYITGTTNYSLGTPFPGGSSSTQSDALFGACLNYDGTLFNKFVSDGSGSDMGKAIAVGTSGKAYITGKTNSTSLNSQSAGSYSANGKAVVLGVDFTTSSPTINYTRIFSTADDSYEEGMDIKVDNSGNVYTVGITSLHSGFTSLSYSTFSPAPTSNSNPENFNCYIVKLNSSGSAVFSTIIGGDYQDVPFSMDLDDYSSPTVVYMAGGSADLAGGTNPFPTTGNSFNSTSVSTQPSIDGSEAFICGVNINHSPPDFLMSGLLGSNIPSELVGSGIETDAGSTFDNISISVNASGDIYFVTTTSSTMTGDNPDLDGCVLDPIHNHDVSNLAGVDLLIGIISPLANGDFGIQELTYWGNDETEWYPQAALDGSDCWYITTNTGNSEETFPQTSGTGYSAVFGPTSASNGNTMHAMKLCDLNAEFTDGYVCEEESCFDLTDLISITGDPTAAQLDNISYSWSPSVADPSCADVSPGDQFSVTVTMHGHCIGTGVIHILQYTLPTLQIDPAPATICSTGGSVPLTALDGDGNAFDAGDLTWSSGSGNPNTVTSSGTYTVTVTDDHSCTASASVTVNEVECCEYPFTPSVSFQNAYSSDLLSDTHLSGYVSSGEIVAPSYKILINGFLKINTANFGFVNCDVKLAKDAYIELESTRTLDIAGSTLEPCTEDMWSDIRLPHSNNVITVEDANSEHSYIKGAKTAINILKNGEADCSDALFVGDYNGIRIYNTAIGQSNSSAITNCDFDGDFITAGYNTPVTSATYGAIGIEVTNVDGLTLGTDNISITHNLIHNFNTGFAAYRSRILIENTDFSHIQLTGITPMSYYGNYSIAGVGVYQQGTLFAPNSLTVTQTDPDHINFELCPYGILTDGVGWLSARQNRMHNIFIGAWANNCIMGNQFINYNKFENVYFGANMSGNLFIHQAEIDSNEFYHLQNLSWTNSITYNDANPFSAQLVDIALNYSEDAQIGIYSNAANVPAFSGNHFFVFCNDMRYSGSSTVTLPATGLSLADCRGTEVRGNSYLGYSTSSSFDLTGFYNYRSPGNYFFCNSSDNSKTGFEYRGDCHGSQLAGNLIGGGTNGHFHGLSLADDIGMTGVIGMQGSANVLENGNRFDGPFTGGFGAFTISSDGNLSTIHYNSSSGSNYGTTSSTSGGYSIPFVNSSTFIDAGLMACNGFSCPSSDRSARKMVDSTYFDQMTYKTDTAFDNGIASGSIDTLIKEGYVDATMYRLRKDLFSKLSILVDSLGSVDSLPTQTLRDFYTSSQAGTIGQFADLYKAFTVFYDTAFVNDSSALIDTIATLIGLNDSISTEGDYQNNEKELNAIILASLTSDTGFTSAGKTFITTLAFGCPFLEGDAVYTARSIYYALTRDTIIFDDSLICSMVSSKWENSNSNFPQEKGREILKSIGVYPNPASSEINVQTQLSEKEEGTVYIYNVHGAKIRELMVTGGAQMHRLQISDLATGVYMYYLHTNQKFDKRGKFVIIR